jgi:hypothetical protein
MVSRGLVWLVATVIALPSLSGAARAQQSSTDSLARGIEIFLQGQVEESVPFFAGAIRQAPRDARGYAWLAETLRRLDTLSYAVKFARRALAIDSCSSFAHTVIAYAYNPQFGSELDVTGDSTWTHLRAAVRCDSTDGNAWMGVWIEALHRGDTALENGALRALVRDRFLTPVWMTHARWILSSLPARSLVLANGDMDTYPPVAAQVVDGLRPDVDIVNAPMLDLPWYVDVLRRRGVPLPQPAQRDSSTRDSDQIIAFWRRSARDGTLGRPFAMLATMGDSVVASGLGVPRLAGGYWLITGGSDSTPDRARLDSAYARADQMEWSGAPWSPRDRSPTRRGGFSPALLVAYVATLDAWSAADRGDAAGARRHLTWAEMLLKRANVPIESADGFLAPLRKRIAGP